MNNQEAYAIAVNDYSADAAYFKAGDRLVLESDENPSSWWDSCSKCGQEAHQNYEYQAAKAFRFSW